MSFAERFMKTTRNEHSWCVNPYINVSIHPRGIIKPCCMANYRYVTDNGGQYLNQESIMNFWDSKDRKKFISDLENGIRREECISCWEEEAAGKESKRIRDNQTYDNESLDHPLVMDLSLGNTCNLKCRICSPTHSSLWMLEEAAIKFPNNQKEFLQDPKWKISKESFNENNSMFWNNIVKLLSNVKKLDFAGGEPFYLNKHWDIVEYCVNEGLSKNQHIHYNTNGTIYPEKYMSLLENFNLIDIQISSDGVGKKFEYLRHPAIFDEVENNIDRFINARNQSNTNWRLSSCISVSAFNVFYFFETFEHYIQKDIGMYINVVHDHHGMRILPTSLKNQIIEYLNSFSSQFNNTIWQKERDMICTHLKNTDHNKQDWKNFISEIKIRDRYRKESYEETFPEYWNLMKEYI